jgi:hypothetical protein
MNKKQFIFTLIIVGIINLSTYLVCASVDDLNVIANTQTGALAAFLISFSLVVDFGFLFRLFLIAYSYFEDEC